MNEREPGGEPGGTEHRNRTENRLFYPALDGVRGFALILVFLQHYLEMPWGWTGVDIFFVLSGFLITGILYDTRHKAERVRTFYVRRTLRIFPLYYGLLLLLFLSTPLLHWQWNSYWWTWPAYLGNYLRLLHVHHQDPSLVAAMNGWLGRGPERRGVLYLGHFWSLCVEEQFYLVWPWVVFAGVSRRRLMVWCCGVIVALPLARMAVAAFASPVYMQLSATVVATPLRADALLLGGLLALLLRGRQVRVVMLVARAIALVAIPLLALLLRRSMQRPGAYVYPAGALTWGLTVVELLAATLILLSLVPGSLTYRVFNLWPLRWLGRVSYGAYVFHDVPHLQYGRCAIVLGRRLPLVAAHHVGTTAVIAAIGTVVLSWASFRYFETPFLRLKERFAPSYNEVPQAAGTAASAAAD